MLSFVRPARIEPTGTILLAATGFANASEPIALSDSQMNSVSADNLGSVWLNLYNAHLISLKLPFQQMPNTAVVVDPVK